NQRTRETAHHTTTGRTTLSSAASTPRAPIHASGNDINHPRVLVVLCVPEVLCSLNRIIILLRNLRLKRPALVCKAQPANALADRSIRLRRRNDRRARFVPPDITRSRKWKIIEPKRLLKMSIGRRPGHLDWAKQDCIPPL